jgi:iron(III) transport system ATP-binding protein
VTAPDRIRCGQLELACAADGFPPGTEVTLAIRPEDIAVLGVRGDQENAVRTRIDAMAFLGSCFRADLVADELDKARLRAELSIELVRRTGLAEGHALPVALPRESLRVYPSGALGE